MSKPKVLIAADHAGFALKEELKKSRLEVEWIDLGTHDQSRVDYPDFAKRLAGDIASQRAPLGVLICGSGIGMSIAANRNPAVRAALVENPIAARLAREHNHANVLCLGARFLAAEYAIELVEAWLDAKPSTEARHVSRIHKMS